MSDLISRKEVIEAAHKNYDGILDFRSDGRTVADSFEDIINALPPAQPEVAQQLYQYKCYITDKEGLQHEVVHAGDIRRITGWEI